MACPRSEECCEATINALTSVRAVIVPVDDLVFNPQIPPEEVIRRRQLYQESIDQILARFRSALSQLNCECSGECCVAAAELLENITVNTLSSISAFAVSLSPTPAQLNEILPNVVSYYSQTVDFILRLACNCNACQCCQDILNTYSQFYTAAVFVSGSFLNLNYIYLLQITQTVQSALFQILECQCQSCLSAANAIARIGRTYVAFIPTLTFNDLRTSSIEDFNGFVDFVTCLACSENCRNDNECCNAVLDALGSIVDSLTFRRILVVIRAFLLLVSQGSPLVNPETVSAYQQTFREITRLTTSSLERLVCQCNGPCCPEAAFQLQQVFVNSYRLLDVIFTPDFNVARFEPLPTLTRLGVDAILSVACSNCACCEAILTALGTFFTTIRTPNRIPNPPSNAIPVNLAPIFFQGLGTLFQDLNRKLIEASCCSVCCETVADQISILVQRAITTINNIDVTPPPPLPTPAEYQAAIDAAVAQFNANAQDIIDLSCCRVPSSVKSTSTPLVALSVETKSVQVEEKTIDELCAELDGLMKTNEEL